MENDVSRALNNSISKETMWNIKCKSNVKEIKCLSASQKRLHAIMFLFNFINQKNKVIKIILYCPAVTKLWLTWKEEGITCNNVLIAVHAMMSKPPSHEENSGRKEGETQRDVYLSQLSAAPPRGACLPLPSKLWCLFTPSVGLNKNVWWFAVTITPVNHSWLFVTSHTFDLRQEDTWLQGPVWHKTLVVNNGAQRAVAQGNAAGVRGTGRLRSWGVGFVTSGPPPTHGEDAVTGVCLHPKQMAFFLMCQGLFLGCSLWQALGTLVIRHVRL